MANDYVAATYRVLDHEIPVSEFERVALDLTTNAGVGTWTRIDLASYGVDWDALHRSHGARLTLLDYESRLIRIEFPLRNLDPVYGSIPFLLNTVAGDLLGSVSRPLKVVELDLPPGFVSCFPGPNLGVQGVRRILATPSRPLLAFSVKPRLGLPLKAFTDLCRDALEGDKGAGVDIVEDDTRLLQIDGATIVERARALRPVLDDFAKSGMKKLYSVNLTGRADQVTEMAKAAIEAGASALKIDVLAAGFSTLQSLTEFVSKEADSSIPIFVYPGMFNAFERFVDRGVLLELTRLCGADIVYAGTPSGAGRIDVTPSDVALMQNH